MTKDDIIRMAREAGFSVGPSRDGPDDVWGVGANLERFFHMAQAAEREACAKVCDDQGQGRFALEHYAALTYAGATHDCANRIRARGQA